METSTIDIDLDAEFEFSNKRLAAYPVVTKPFEYFFPEGFFSAEFYRELLANLPADNAYRWGRSADPYEANRGNFLLGDPAYLAKLPSRQREIWSALAKWMLSDSFMRLFLSKFAPQLAERARKDPPPAYVCEVKLNRDKENYALRPHTDSPDRIATLMVYLPKDNSLENHGTAIYAPKEAGVRCAGLRRHPFSNFNLVTKAKFVPNAGMAFLKSDVSFHGVEKVEGENIQRDFITYLIRDTQVERKQRKQQSMM